MIIGDFTQESAEETYEKFLLKLKKGIYVGGDYVSIDPAEAQWMNEKRPYPACEGSGADQGSVPWRSVSGHRYGAFADVEVEVQKGKMRCPGQRKYCFRWKHCRSE